MRYIRQHITAIIDSYDGGLPLAHFLRNYFRQQPKLGSRDRRIISAIVYSWYRCSKGISNRKWIEELTSQWIDSPASFTNFSLPQWLTDNRGIAPFDLQGLFPYNTTLSSGMDMDAWLESMLVQPDLFIRVRKDKSKIVTLLNGQQIPYTFVTDTCLALPNGAKIDTLLPPDTYVVQDASSQRTGDYFAPQKNELWYDCCSGAGGKSLLLKDKEPAVRLTASDARGSIIHNLQQRFTQYGHKQPTAHVIDATDAGQLTKALGNVQFDNIICDAPCCGSGTWARTPEQLYFFVPESMDKFSTLQKQIAINVSRFLKPGGKLFYITCSIFKAENEDVVDEVIQQTGMQLIQSHLINGIHIKADSMFIAVLSS